MSVRLLAHHRPRLARRGCGTARSSQVRQPAFRRGSRPASEAFGLAFARSARGSQVEEAKRGPRAGGRVAMTGDVVERAAKRNRDAAAASGRWFAQTDPLYYLALVSQSCQRSRGG